MTFGQLLQDGIYRVKIMKALKTERIQTLTSREIRII